MGNPTDLKYLDTHEWFRADGDVVTVGITQFAADELTDITFVDLPAVGTEVRAGKPFGEIESVKATSELITAIGGVIKEVNTRLADQPELVNNDPFKEGWMVRIKSSDPAVLSRLMDSAAYDRHCASQAH